MTTTNSKEVEEWTKRAKRYRDTLYGKQYLLYINKQQNNSELCESMRNACDAIDALIENNAKQLQKARHDWLREEIVRLEGIKAAYDATPDIDEIKGRLPITDGQMTKGWDYAFQTIIERYQAELKSK